MSIIITYVWIFLYVLSAAGVYGVPPKSGCAGAAFKNCDLNKYFLIMKEVCLCRGKRVLSRKEEFHKIAQHDVIGS